MQAQNTSKQRHPANSYTVNLVVRLESLTGDPTWEVVAEAVRGLVFGGLPTEFQAGRGSVYITDVELDTAEEEPS